MATKRKLRKPASCAACAGTDVVRRITTYVANLTGPLQGKQIDVGRVPLYQCQSCGHLMPTAIGQAKVDHLVEIGTKIFLGQMPQPGEGKRPPSRKA